MHRFSFLASVARVASTVLVSGSLGLAATTSLALAQALPPPQSPYPQQQPPPPGYPPQPGYGQPATNPICPRLEGQLALIDRGGGDPAKADQIRRYEDAAAKQQAELERVTVQAKRMGCDSSGFFSLFTQNSAQCGPINSQIQQMRGNMDQINSGLAQLRGGGGAERENQRRSVLTALAQNNCGPQYVAAARAAQQSGGFFSDLFGGGGGNASPVPMPDMGPPASTFRTVCVRTCDGYYFPISYATVPSRFGDDERSCKQLCPAAEATLYTFRNPGEDINQAVSISGQPYTALPNAFKYRQEFNPSCSCRAAGQSWADALKNIDERSTAAENGDIIVTDENARKMALPRDSQSRSAKQAKGSTPPTAPATAGSNGATTGAPAAKDGSKDGDKPIRSVGPTFIPAK
jgi:hypothetical protein